MPEEEKISKNYRETLTFVHVGKSMEPTLKSLDIIYVTPYDDKKIKAGDVIAFIGPEGQKIAHRVISVKNNKILTRGDNNIENDKLELTLKNIMGKVELIKRNNKTISIKGGFHGQILRIYHRVFKICRNIIYKILKAPYDIVSNSGIFRGFLDTKKLKVILINRQDMVELQLMYDEKVIGKKFQGDQKWKIYPPYKIFIDESQSEKILNK
jgi:signal peptidase I